MPLTRLMNTKTFRLDYDLIGATVDYSQDLSQIISDLGVGYVLSRIFNKSSNEDYLIEKKDVQFVVVGHTKIVDSDVILSDMALHGIRPVDIFELICLLNTIRFNKENLDKFVGTDLVALNSVVLLGPKKHKFVPMYRSNRVGGQIVPMNFKAHWPLRVSFVGIFEK